MTIDLILGLLVIVAFLATDFLMFKYFVHNKKGLIQMLMAKCKAGKKVTS